MANPPKDLSQGFEHWAALNPMPDIPADATVKDVYKAAGFKFYTIKCDEGLEPLTFPHIQPTEPLDISAAIPCVDSPDQTPGAQVFLPDVKPVVVVWPGVGTTTAESKEMLTPLLRAAADAGLPDGLIMQPIHHMEPTPVGNA